MLSVQPTLLPSEEMLYMIWYVLYMIWYVLCMTCPRMELVSAFREVEHVGFQPKSSEQRQRDVRSTASLQHRVRARARVSVRARARTRVRARARVSVRVREMCDPQQACKAYSVWQGIQYMASHRTVQCMASYYLVQCMYGK